MTIIDGIVYRLNFPSFGTATVGYKSDFSGAAIIPPTVTDDGTTYAVVAIGVNAFYITGLTSVTIPDSVTSIGNYAFGGCSELTSVTFLGGAPAVGFKIFDDSPSTIVYYTAGKPGWTNPWEGRPTFARAPPPPPALPVKHNYTVYFRK